MRLPEDLSLSKQSVTKIWNIEDITVNTVPNENANKLHSLTSSCGFSTNHKVCFFDSLFLDKLLVGILQIFLLKMLFVHDSRSQIDRLNRYYSLIAFLWSFSHLFLPLFLRHNLSCTFIYSSDEYKLDRCLIMKLPQSLMEEIWSFRKIIRELGSDFLDRINNSFVYSKQ